MKKNLMSVLIMALVFVNVVLSAVTMITLVPSAKKSNELIEQICGAIDLELDSGKVFNANSIPLDQVDVVSLTPDGPATFTLRKTDSEPHFAVTPVSISLNKEDTDYETKKPLIDDRKDLLMDIVTKTFLKYSYDEVVTTDGQERVRDEMLQEMQELFDSDFIIAVTLSNPNYQ